MLVVEDLEGDTVGDSTILVVKEEDMMVLWRHYAGEGNASRRIAEAEKIKKTLMYKHE